MKFAIISAGEGSRLSQEGIQVPKPLVRLNGEAMIDRLIRIFTDCEAEEVVVIVNNLTSLVQEHLNRLDSKVPLKVVVKTTPSSMHSFYELSPYLGEGKFCLTTVDTVFREDEFKEYISDYVRDYIKQKMILVNIADKENISEFEVKITESRQCCLILRVLNRKLRRNKWGYSSAGRAPALQAGGQRFDPVYLHHRLRN